MNTKQTSYSEKLRDPRWQKKRLCVMQRDGFACRDCHDSTSTLQVHHCYYEKGGPWMTDERFLLTLCQPCHEERGELEADGKRMLGMIFANAENYVQYSPLRQFVTSMSQHCDKRSVELRVVDDDVIQDAINFGRGFCQATKASNE
jgi:hypothetical protein